MRLPRPLRSLRNRLALVFGAIVLLAIVVIYLYVVPQLQSSLRQEKLQSLAHAAKLYTHPIHEAVDSGESAKHIAAAVSEAADRSAARVVMFLLSNGTLGLQAHAEADSSQSNARNLSFPIVLRAARTGQLLTGVESTPFGAVGEAAMPLHFRAGGRSVVSRVVVYSTPLDDVAANVGLIRREILIAGAIALVVAVLGGYLVARALSLRVKRLERAAGKVAAGDFSQPIPAESEDELGQLARAFNDMQRQLAQLDTARKQFIATASHELRTPIFSLGGFLELMEDEDMDPATRTQFVAQLREQVDRLGKLATELLDLSRLEAGSLDLRPELVDIGMLARSVTAEFVPALQRHDSHLELRLARRPIEAVCDPERVTQIMRILVDNALTHTPPGTDIVVTANRSEDRVRLGVSDGGGGISADTAVRIFEPFYTSDDQRGAGLGLAIARELAERMRGHLGVDSHDSRTTFTLEFPG